MTPDPVPPTLADLPTVRLTKLRERLLSIPHPQYQIAALAGIHPSKLSMYARGEKDMSAKHLLALCHILHCEPEDIVGWTERPAPNA